MHWRRRRRANTGSTPSFTADTRGEFEHAEVSVFVGKNPWMSQSFPAGSGCAQRDQQGSGALDDRDRPVLTDTAKLADFHLRVEARRRRVVSGRVGRCSGAGKSLRRSLSRRARHRCRRGSRSPSRHTHSGLRAPLRCRRRPDPCFGTSDPRAESVAVFEDLGIQQAPNSTLCSYLNKMLWILTGNFAKGVGSICIRCSDRSSARRHRAHTGDRCASDRGVGAVQRHPAEYSRTRIGSGR